MVNGIFKIDLLKQFIVDHPEATVGVGDMFVYKLIVFCEMNQTGVRNFISTRYQVNINMKKNENRSPLSYAHIIWAREQAVFRNFPDTYPQPGPNILPILTTSKLPPVDLFKRLDFIKYFHLCDFKQYMPEEIFNEFNMNLFNNNFFNNNYFQNPVNNTFINNTFNQNTFQNPVKNAFHNNVFHNNSFLKQPLDNAPLLPPPKPCKWDFSTHLCIYLTQNSFSLHVLPL
jgi:hypothetical protein